MKKLIYVVALLNLIFVSCKNQPVHNDPIPTHETIAIHSTEVSEKRVINIWTPPSYATSNDSLAVLYMLDGGIKEDFAHVANSLDSLIKAKSIKPIILVGIENTERRRDLSGPTSVEKDKEIAPVVGQSTKFRNFIDKELFSVINKKYRTTPEKGIIGESLAGLFVTETLLYHPEMFDFYIAFDPSLWWNDQHLIKNAAQRLAAFPNKEIRFWFAGSNAEDINPHTKKLFQIINDIKSPNFKWEYSDKLEEQHNTIFRATKTRALIWSLNQ
ncbi:MAG: alpha/beta hydrolase [Saprospiraceae bacterium]|nr:alpha/beta hydrolase [Saprospiraceae bacterium]